MVKKEMAPSSTVAAPSKEDIEQDVHGAIELALKARSDYLIQEASTMTLLKARRLLETDLNVEAGFLDPHKDFVKGLINKLLQGPGAGSPETQETEKEHEKKKEPDQPESSADQKLKPKTKRLKKKTDSEGVKDNVLKSQVSDAGVSSTEEGIKKSTDEEIKKSTEEEIKKSTEEEIKENTEEEIKENTEEGIKKPEVDNLSDGKEVDMESLIREAIRKRAPYFKSQAESLTVLGVRRLLEEDLSLEKGGLDGYKQEIRKVLDQVLNAEDEEEPVPVTNAKKRKAAASEGKSKSNKSGKKRKAAKSEIEENASDESERTPKVRNGVNRKSTKTKVVEEEDVDASGDNDDDNNDGESSKGDSSGVEDSDDEETERKKTSKPKKAVESKPVYGKKVEHLKSTIKACGITVPPSVYKKAKQAPEQRRETVLIKELEAILTKEGLTANASKDDIKAVRKRKQKLKDLEGIDTSNIIGETRGRRSRTSASFFAPQCSEPVDLGDEDEDEDEEEEQESDSEEDPNVEILDDEDED